MGWKNSSKRKKKNGAVQVVEDFHCNIETLKTKKKLYRWEDD